MLNEKFDELKLTGNLPSPSGVGLKILQLTQCDDYNLDDLAALIRVDPALTGRVIQVANSAAYAAHRPATTVNEAAMRLGGKKVRAVALGFSLVSGNRSGACKAFSYERYWSWSLACAVAAQAIARVAGSWDPVEAFTCGLLARIGKLALATVHPEAYSGVLAELQDAVPGSLLREERRVFHIHHLEVSAAMMEDWGLPEEFVTAVLSLQVGQEEPEDPTEVTVLSLLLRAASTIASECLEGRPISDPEWRAGSRAMKAVRDELKIDDQGLTLIVASIIEEWPRWGELLEIPTGSIASGQIFKQQQSSIFKPQVFVGDDPDDAGDDDAREGESHVSVLAVDDDPKQLRLLTHHLTRAGYDVLTANNGEEALRMSVEHNPHIVVTDWMMPGLNGIDLCKSLRQTEAGRNMYVLLLTAREAEERVVEAFNAGADDYVCKPFNPRILLARVQAGQRLIELQRQVDEDKKHRMQQVAEMGRLTRKLRAAALTDVLTELPNRRYAMKRLAEEWGTAVRGGRPLSVIMVDIDFFKQVNDIHGHDVGDVVLRETARVLRSRTRRGDLVCRLGGEEFLVININSTADTAVVCAERLRTAVEENVIQAGGFTGNVTVSLGLAEIKAGMKNADDLLKAADQAVYRAKDEGRNLVVQADDGTVENDRRSA